LRTFRTIGTQAIEVRVEAFNVFNWFEWGQPNVTFSAPTFGQISSTNPSVPPRVMQLAVKYTF